MDLTERLIHKGYLKTQEIIQAFKTIKRRDFVLPSMIDKSNIDEPLSIGCEQTISQPLTVAFMLELLEPRTDQKNLDIGSGSGWTTALLAEIVGKNGKVFGVERISELKVFGENNANKYGFVDSGRTVFIVGDGSKGLSKYAPFDRIHVGAAANQVPEPLLEQLAVGGKMVIPEGIDFQNIVLIEKTAKGEYKRKSFPGFVFVPLIIKDNN
jgi:protein-L-isoaspartate(D-aspartate) O-methyltransferase